MSYQLKITLKNSRRPSGARILVPAECPTRNPALGDPEGHGLGRRPSALFSHRRHGIYGPRPMGGKMDSDGEDAALYRLSDVVSQAKAKFTYEYDFGDDWNHTIILEKIIPAGDAGAGRLAQRLCVPRRQRGLSAGRLRRPLGLLRQARSSPKPRNTATMRTSRNGWAPSIPTPSIWRPSTSGCERFPSNKPGHYLRRYTVAKRASAPVAPVASPVPDSPAAAALSFCA